MKEQCSTPAGEGSHTDKQGDAAIALWTVRAIREKLERSPGLGEAPFSDHGWATIEDALVARSAVAPITEAQRQLSLARDMLKSCIGVPFKASERDACVEHITKAFHLIGAQSARVALTDEELHEIIYSRVSGPTQLRNAIAKAIIHDLRTADRTTPTK